MRMYKLQGGETSSVIEWIASYHQPELAEIENDHVPILFSDGELCLTKCGSLFGMRGLHMIDSPLEAYKKLPKEAWPASYSGYDCIFCTEEQAIMIRKELECLI